MQMLRRLVAPIYRDECAPFKREGTWSLPPGYTKVDVHGDRGVTLATMLSKEGNMRDVLKAAAKAARLDRGLTSTLVNVAGMALLDQLARDMPRMEGAVAAILKKDPTAQIQLHVEVTDPHRADGNVLIVFHLDTCLFPTGEPGP
jgi:hypothetical protein